MRPKRRRVLLTIVVPAIAAIIGAACTFPEVTFLGVSDGGNDTGSGESGTTDGGSDSPTRVDADPDGEVIVVDGGRVDEASCDSACDCDDDKYLSAACAEGGLVDCDDLDDRTHPNQKYLAIPPEPPRNGDWNCVGGLERFLTPNVKCANVAGGAACDGTQGFEDNPACGDFGIFIKCKTSGLCPLCSCVNDVRELNGAKQACK